jgi:exoribonuclease R
VEPLAGGATRLLVGIADVDSAVPQSSAIDQHASAQTVSVYTGVTTFPMLPDQLSTDLTSLLGAADRLAVVIDLQISPSGSVDHHDVYLATVRNRAKLAYSTTGPGSRDAARSQLRSLPLPAWPTNSGSRNSSPRSYARSANNMAR